MKRNEAPKYNPVAKHAHKCNRAVAFRNRKTDYKRKDKHVKNGSDE